MKMAEVLWGPQAWCQGFAYLHEGTSGRYCLLGALAAVTHGSPFRRTDSEISRLKRVVFGLTGEQSIIGFNDAPGRTWDEVAAVVDAFDRDRLLNP